MLVNRGTFDANVSKRDLEAYYLKPFAACLREGKAGSLMCSYGAVNGVPVSGVESSRVGCSGPCPLPCRAVPCMLACLLACICCGCDRPGNEL